MAEPPRLLLTVVLFGLVGLTASAALLLVLYAGLRISAPPRVVSRNSGSVSWEATRAVLPPDGFQSQIELGDSIIKMVQAGVIDREKFTALYRERGGLPRSVATVLDRASHEPMHLSAATAAVYVNLLWPLGMANHLAVNQTSPIAGPSAGSFASTGGWTLGKAATGAEYFDKLTIVPLTPAQEALVLKIAQHSYRPCCDNPTFFQDCNHGSALLGLLELGAAQGLSEEQLWHEALAFNSYWFPSNYVATARYFSSVRGVDWVAVDPREVMSQRYSSLSGWTGNVARFVPPRPGTAACGA